MTPQQRSQLRVGDVVHTEGIRNGLFGCREDVIDRRGNDLSLPQRRARWGGGGALPVEDWQLAITHLASKCPHERGRKVA